MISISFFIATTIHPWNQQEAIMWKRPSFIKAPGCIMSYRPKLKNEKGIIACRHCHHQFLDERNLHSTDQLAASRHGLDPLQNTHHHPIVYHEHYSFTDWPENHSFPMDKFQRLGHYLTNGHNLSLTERPLVASYYDFFRPLDAWDIPRSWLAKPTGPIEVDFLNRFLSASLTEQERRYIGFREQTSRPELIQRTLLEVAGTILAAQLAHRYMISTNTAGGTHHASPSQGAGYTILNDLAITAHFLTDEELNGGSVRDVKRVLVVDCDVHQGDGTAKFSSDILKGRLFTLSLHCASNYPRYKAQSTYDVGLPDDMKDDEYMEILETSLDCAIREVDPHFILYDAGVDVYEHDNLGRLKISEEGIRRRDRHVLETCIRLGIPVVGVIGGGYDRDVDALARRHAIVHEEAAALWRKYKLWIQ